MKKSLIFVFLISTAFQITAQTPAFDKNRQLGRGINLGNMFEAPSETEWGNPFQDKYMSMIAGLGFDHVRIPIRWEPADRSMATTPYTISPDFLQRIKHVVDLARVNKLHAIINMHHHEALYEDPDGQKERFLNMWDQVATYFANYSDSLLFEILNEPHGNLSAVKWNQFAADALTVIRKTNPSRFVIIGTAEYGGLGGLSKLQLPEDNRLIVTIHYYNPFHFTHQGASWAGDDAKNWLGTKWQDTESERKTVQTEFASLVQFSKDHNVPVHIGEFGAYSAADLQSRKLWTTYLARYFESLGFSWAYWEFSAGFGIYNRTNDSYIQELVDALLHNPMSDATPVNRTEIKKTLFETTGNMEGWNLGNSSGASSTSKVENGQLSIQIANGGTSAWSVQLRLNNILLEKGKNYEVIFRAKSNGSRSISTYIGMNRDPWSSYSGYPTFQMNEAFNEFTYSFQMQNDSDPQSRVVFDLGNSTQSFELDYFIINEVSIASAVNTISKDEPFFYPNPVKEIIYFRNDRNALISLFSLSGRLLIEKEINSNPQINVGWLANGIYLITKKKGNSFQSARLVKIN